jgi:hypothetical protein
MKEIDKIKAKVEIAEYEIRVSKAINKALMEVQPPFNLLVATILAKAFQKIQKQKHFEIWDKHKNGNKFLEENELIVGDFEKTK